MYMEKATRSMTPLKAMIIEQAWDAIGQPESFYALSLNKGYMYQNFAYIFWVSYEYYVNFAFQENMHLHFIHHICIYVDRN